jgi:hypothetical protein
MPTFRTRPEPWHSPQADPPQPFTLSYHAAATTTVKKLDQTVDFPRTTCEPAVTLQTDQASLPDGADHREPGRHPGLQPGRSAGGPDNTLMSGSYASPKLTGCGLVTPVLNSLVSGPANPISVHLTMGAQ